MGEARMAMEADFHVLAKLCEEGPDWWPEGEALAGSEVEG
jgi:hypothetical protein